MIPDPAPGLAPLLPPPVRAVETHAVVDDGGFPSERAAVANAVPERRWDHATVRTCARRALAALDHAPCAIDSGPMREPLWPPGIVGSLTHCAGYRAAAVARADDVASLGIDAEPARALPDGVLDMITVPREESMLRALVAADAQVPWDTVLFSAKESIYKAWFPLYGRWLDFTECELTLDTEGFVGQVLVDERPTFTGHWRIHGEHVLTAVAVR